MSLQVVEVAEAAAGVLATAQPDLAPTVRHNPKTDVPEGAPSRVYVVPAGLAATPAARDAHSYACAIHVALVKKLNKRAAEGDDEQELLDEQELRSLAATTSALADLLSLATLQLGGGIHATCVEFTAEPIYDPELLENNRVYLAVQRFVFQRVHRPQSREEP